MGLKELEGLAGVVPISGQDATADGCNGIFKAELTVSILKDIRNLFMGTGAGTRLNGVKRRLLIE